MRVMDYNTHVVLKQHDFISHAVHWALLYFGVCVGDTCF